MSRLFSFSRCLSLPFLCAGLTQVQAAPVSPFPAPTAPPEPVQKLAPMVVQETSAGIDPLRPQGAESIAANRIQETINILDTEDAVKYLPSLFLRKRNYGDTQAVMATRVWGVSSGARSLVYADGLLLSALIANNNSIGAPRWGLVAPSEIERIDVMYGPFGAAYPGNSMGAVVEITTRMPERFEAAFTQALAFQDFSQYGTKGNYRTAQTAVTVGNRAGKFSLRASANHQDSHSQPLNYITSAAYPANTNGGFAASNKVGAPAHVMGAGGLLYTRMTNAKLKAAYAFAPRLRAAYTFGVWRGDTESKVETYLRNAAGQPTYAGLAGFATGTFQLRQQHTSHGVSLRADPAGNFEVEASASVYRIDQDEQRTPTTASNTAAAAPGFAPAGRRAVLEGTGWSTLDLKATWRPDGAGGRHVTSFGIHHDRNRLFNPTHTVADWRAAGPVTGLATEGDGKTRTQALWAQDAWRLAPNLLMTVGARYEAWRAYDGLNVNGDTVVRQPTVRARGWSPKATMAWDPLPPSSSAATAARWLVTGSLGQARRFPTVAELYQLVSTGTTFTAPDANLKPEEVLAAELRVERTHGDGRVRVSLFQDDVHDALIAQFNPLGPASSALFSYVSNIDHVRARGVEVVLQHNNVFLPGLELYGSATYLAARTLALSGRASATAPAAAAIGRRLPNIPDWRATFLATYRRGERWSVTLGGRYSGMLYTTLDNADVNPNTWQGFAAWFVADVRAHARFGRGWSASLGVDNLLNRKYFLFHPFPHRTLVADLKFSF